jgi:queuine tRNA-ribosyltransferase
MKGVKGGFINLRNSKYKDDPTPLDETLGLYSSATYSKAYIQHLLKAGEMLAFQIVSQHNVAVIARLMREIRAALKSGEPDALEKLRKEWLPE